MRWTERGRWMRGESAAMANRWIPPREAYLTANPHSKSSVGKALTTPGPAVPLVDPIDKGKFMFAWSDEGAGATSGSRLAEF